MLHTTLSRTAACRLSLRASRAATFRTLTAAAVTGIPKIGLQTPTSRLQIIKMPVNGGARFQSGGGLWKAPVISYEEVKAKSDQPSPKSYIIDVREPDEVVQGSIPSSVSIPLSGLTHSLDLPDIEFEAKHGFKKPAKDEEVIFYCRSGKRSTSASEEAHQKGWTNIKNYTGSWLNWVDKQQKAQKANKFDDDD